MNKIDLNGRCAVVTGGAQGFGRAITERFVASGAKVAIWDHDQPFAEKTAREIGSAVTAFKVDVSDLAAVEAALMERGAPSGTREQLAVRPDVQAMFQALLDGINEDLAQFEKISAHLILGEEGRIAPVMVAEAADVTDVFFLGGRAKVFELDKRGEFGDRWRVIHTAASVPVRAETRSPPIKKLSTTT